MPTLIIEGEQYEVLEDQIIEIGDTFIDVRYPLYAIAEEITEDMVYADCRCGECTREDRAVPKEFCRKIKLIIAQFN